MKLLAVLLIGGLMAFSPTNTPKNENLAPEITLNNSDGEEVKLSSLKGNIVLVDFWASWCGPCRRGHPALVSVYNEFKDATFKNAKGFKIYSVSLDRNKAAWLAAIKKDKLTWEDHVSELNGWNTAPVQTYGVRGIPYSVLLNEKGEIIAKNLHGTSLKRALQKLQ